MRASLSKLVSALYSGQASHRNMTAALLQRSFSILSSTLQFSNLMLGKVLPAWYPNDGISSAWYDSHRPHLKCLMLHLNLQRSSIFLVAILKQKSCFRKEGFLKSWKQTTDHRRPCYLTSCRACKMRSWIQDLQCGPEFRTCNVVLSSGLAMWSWIQDLVWSPDSEPIWECM